MATKRKRKTILKSHRKAKSVKDEIAAAEVWAKDMAYDFFDDVDMDALPPQPHIGRPSSYDPRYCLVMLHKSWLGYSEEEVAAVLKVSFRSFDNWQGRHPEFLQARVEGSVLREAHYLRNMRGISSGGLKGHAQMTVFALTNINPAKWKNKQTFEGRTEVVDETPALDETGVADMSDARKRRLLAALTTPPTPADHSDGDDNGE